MEDKYDKNPFLNEELLVNLGERKVKLGSGNLLRENSSEQGVNRDTGEVLPIYQYMYTRKLVDSQKFTKIYNNNMKQIFKLSNSGLSILEYVCNILEMRKDFISINVEECQMFCNYDSRQSVYNGLRNLMKAGIIAKGKGYYKYWINPSVLFNGDRLTIINEYILEKRKTIDLQIEEGTEEDKKLEQKFKNSSLNS